MHESEHSDNRIDVLNLRYMHDSLRIKALQLIFLSNCLFFLTFGITFAVFFVLMVRKKPKNPSRTPMKKVVKLTNPKAIDRIKKFLEDKAFIRKMVKEGKTSEIKTEVNLGS
jgi:hypothetical protein